MNILKQGRIVGKTTKTLNKHKIVNRKDIYGLARKRAKLKIMKVSSAQIEAFERDYWIRYNKIQRCGAVGQLAGLITQRSQVRILLAHLNEKNN